MIKQSKCKICRRVGDKLFLRGDRCSGVKCSLIKRPYAPGQKPKRRKAGLSEYGRELREKQKIKRSYNLTEKEFKGYVSVLLDTGTKLVEDVPSAFVKSIETRLDNIIFRLGLAKSRGEARQMVTHGHFLVNGSRTDIPSRQLKVGDKISIRKGSREKAIFKNIEERVKKIQLPTWLSMDKKTLEAEIKKYPKIDDVQLAGELSAVFEHYSR
ncbi:MAG TPA: 30S ribosomal protein S4 [Candidatus Pacearchaeota archaeon]|nr:30S ribosomal protein S4 [Candidatus Pacearchaeota archaeon]